MGFYDPSGVWHNEDPGQEPAPTTPTPSTGNTGLGLQTELTSAFPWLARLGLDISFFQELEASSASDAEKLAKIRGTSQYKQKFTGMTRADGTMRMNEAQYLATEDSYKQLLRQYGYGDRYEQGGSLVGFFEGEVDPNELKDRLQTYKQVKESSQSVKDAFYVYSGKTVTDEQLYQAAVDPAAAQKLTDEFNARVALQPLDYATWITRATEVGLQRVAKTLTDEKAAGNLTGQAIQSVLQTDPSFARQMMDALYHGGDPASGSYLNLDELTSAFEYAAIGAAASNVGLTLPTKERVAQIRAAGVDRSKATSSYQAYARSKGIYDGAVQRIGGTGFNQNDFETTTFLGGDQTQLQQALAAEDAAGKDQGGFQVGSDRTGRFQQKGLKAPGA